MACILDTLCNLKIEIEKNDIDGVKAWRWNKCKYFIRNLFNYSNPTLGNTGLSQLNIIFKSLTNNIS